MSVAINNALGSLYRGEPWNGSAYPGAVEQPDLTNFSTCGLAYHVGAGGGTYEALFAMSRRYAGGNYLFYGKPDGAIISIQPDFGSGVKIIGAVAADTWFQFAFRSDGVATSAFLKLIADSVWQKQTWPANAPNFVPQRMLLGNDEWNSTQAKWALDNVRVFSGGVPLTDAELLAQVNSAALLADARVWAWWKLRADNPLADSSGNNRPLSQTHVPGAFADSPLEAPADGSTAAGSATFSRRSFAVSGFAASAAQAAGSARLAAFVSTGVAQSRASSIGATSALRFIATGVAGVTSLPASAVGSASIFRRPIVVRGRATSLVGVASQPVDGPTVVVVQSVNTAVIIRTVSTPT